MLDYLHGLANQQQAEDRNPDWMGFTEIRADLRTKRAADTHWLRDSSCLSEYRDAADRQWCLLSKRYDENSWGGLLHPELQEASTQATKFGIGGGRKKSISQVILDPDFDGEPYTKELYENACHVQGAGATWRLNTGPGTFRFRLHLLDWWHGGDRRFILILSSGDTNMERIICTPANGHARIDEFVVHVGSPSTTMELQIIRDDGLPGDSFPCFSGFDVQRLHCQQEALALKREAAKSTPCKQSPCHKVSDRQPKSQPVRSAQAPSALGKHTACRQGDRWDGARMVLSAPPDGLLSHPDDPNDPKMFKCISRCSPDGRQEVIGLLAASPDMALASSRGLVITCPGAGGGPGPADPLGGAGGGTYGGYNVYGKLASELPKQGIAVLLLHYPPGDPGHPLQGGISRTQHHIEALMQWVREHASPQLPVALVGWSMGGAVAIEAAASTVSNRTMCIRGVATIASMKEVSPESPSVLVKSQVELLLMHNLSKECNASNSWKLARLAGDGIEPLLFPDENHGVRSAFNKLSVWLPALFSH